jgi:hypothetical protein
MSQEEIDRIRAKFEEKYNGGAGNFVTLPNELMKFVRPVYELTDKDWADIVDLSEEPKDNTFYKSK